MTIEEHICSGGIATVPDLRGGRECYGADYDSMVITQDPPPGEEVGAGQTIINVITEDGNGNATLCTHYLNVTADNPAPTLICPDPINAWLPTGGWVVPDLTDDVEIIGGCTVLDDLIITQSPAAGTLITSVGVSAIIISVTDAYGHTVVCGSTSVTLRPPNEVNPDVEPPEPPTENPSHFYTPNLLAYWPFDDVALYRDAVVLLGRTPRDLTNISSSIDAGETVLGSCFGPAIPGPIFGTGSMYMNRNNNHYATLVDDSEMRLVGVSWTMRFGLKVVAADAGAAKNLVRKHQTGSGAGYAIELLGFGGAVYGLYIALFGAAATPIVDITQFGFSTGSWYVVTVTMDDTNGVLKLYRDGGLVASDTNAGQHITGTNQPFVVGATNGISMEVYIDQLGIWTEAWDASRVMDDYMIVTCM